MKFDHTPIIDAFKLPGTRKIVPKLVTEWLSNIVSVQPMDKPSGSVFHYNYIFGRCTGMREVTVNKAELIKMLEENREQHNVDFEKALKGYYIELAERLEEALKLAKEKAEVVPSVHLQKPTNHDSDYGTALGMLQMEVSDTVTISDHEYATLVEDDWDWKRQWYAPSSSNTLYMAKAANR